MNFTTDLQRFQYEILDPNLSINERALLRCRWAKQFEETGNFETARDALGELWTATGERPELEGLNEATSAEVLLRTGTLTGWIGSTRQIEGAQEKAKNLITESIEIFQALDQVKKVAEAKIEIAVCYRREGELDNARVVLAEALSKLDEKDGDLIAVALVRSAFVEKVAHRFREAYNILTKAAPLFESSANHTLKGRFHNEFAIVLENLGAIEDCADYLEQAAMEYTAASLDFEQAGHSRYQACVENNLAMLYLKVNRVADAHEHLDRAQALFTRLGDLVHLAQLDETRARAWLAENEYIKAEKIARSAVMLLEKGDEPLLLSEALITHSIALSHLNRLKEAQAGFRRAIKVAEQTGELERAGLAAITLVEQIGPELSDDELCDTLETARELLKGTENPTSRGRLLECAFSVISLLHTFHSTWTNYSFDKRVHRYEEREIRRALEHASGVISHAARLLGLTHQRLHQILKNRHRDLRLALPEILATEQETNLDSDPNVDLNALVHKEVEIIRILHVEDNEMVAAMVKETLENQGWQVETCADGTTALEKISGEDEYDLLVVDYDLPGVNGVEIINRARELDHRCDMPVVMLAASPVEAAARKAGADVFLRKPQDVTSLVETINRFLEEREQEQ